MKAITMKQGPYGSWYAMHGRTTLAMIVPSVLDRRLGIRVTTDAVRDAVRECSPGYGVTDVTPVSWPKEK